MGKGNPFNQGSWAVFVLAFLLIAASLTQTIYRLSLPWDGWSFTRDLSGAGLRLVFNQSIVALPSSLERGDVLVAVQGQSLEQLLSEALTFQPQRPTNWQVGNYATYTVQRTQNGVPQALTVLVPLVRLSPLQTLFSVAQTLLTNPTILPSFLIGLFVFVRRPNDYAARLLFLLTTCFFSSEGISQAVVHSNVIGPSELFDSVAFWGAQFFNALIWPFLVAPIYINLFWRFPITKRPLREHQRLTLTVLYGFLPALTFVAWLFTHAQPLVLCHALRASAGEACDTALVFWSTWSTISGLAFVFTLVLGILSVGHSWWRAHNYAERAQIRWVALGIIVTSVGALMGGVLATLGVLGLYPLLDLFIWRVPMLALPVSLAIAILRYRLFDIDVVIRRTLIYGVLTASLLTIYFGSVVLLQQLFRATTGQQQSEIVTVISTLAIAALFVPLRRRIQVAIDHRFYRRKYDAQRVLANFAATARDVVELDKLTDQLLEVVDETMQPTQISLWLKQQPDRTLSSHFQDRE